MSLAILAHSSLADRIKLTPEQRAQVAAVLTERTDALSKAPEKDRTRITRDYERQLASLLSEEQRVELVKKPPEPLLKFNYRFQRWVDVLEEIAKQAGLSLVLDAPRRALSTTPTARNTRPPRPSTC